MRQGRFGDRDRRSRRWRAWWALLRWGVALGAIVAAGVYAYDLGTRLARQDVGRLEAELVGARAERDAAIAERDTAAEARAAAEAETAAWQARHAAEVPTGALADLAALVGRRLGEGMDAERLAFVIERASAVRDCPAAPQTKRFLVQTPLSDGAGAAVGFADGTVTVSGTGVSAQDGSGNPLARFDPTQPVTLRFALIDGTVSEASGTLPLNHAVVSGAFEHRFSVIAGDGGFAVVTGETCRFP